MNKRKLFYLTRRTSFLWKSSLVLAVVLIALGSGISFFNTGRLDAMQNIMAAPRYIDEFSDDLDELRPGHSDHRMVTHAVCEILANETSLYEKLELIQYVLRFTMSKEVVEPPVAEKLPDLSADEYTIVAAFISSLSKQHDDEALQELTHLAEADDPLPVANYALALVHEGQSSNLEAVEALKREIEHHNNDSVRRKLIALYLDINDYASLEQLKSDPDFKPLITNYVLREIALSKMDWPILIKVHFLSSYEGTNVAMAALALFSGLVWTIILLRFNGSLSVVRFTIPALALGVCSTHATVLFIYWQEHQLGFNMGSDVINQIIYCLLGIGLREELLKLLCFVPLIPFLLKRNDLEILTIAGLVGLGFAIEENINYFQSSAGLSALGRFATANFLHIVLTAMCGLALTRAITDKGKNIENAAVTFGMAVGIHGLYDAFIMVPVLADYSFLSLTMFILMSYQYFGWLRYLRDDWRDPISTTSIFTYGVILVSSMSFGLFAWRSGPFLAFQAVGHEVIGIAIILILYYREIPETIE